MAEAAAIIGLVSSIASLIELSAKVVSRLHEFTSKSSELPESFRSLSSRLPLLTVTLQRIQIQAEAGHLLNAVAKALKAVVENTSEQVLAVQTRLSKILPPDDASKLERALKALKSLANEGKFQQAVEKIHKNNDILILHQTTRHVDTGDRILEELLKLSVATPTSGYSFGVCLGQAPQIAPDAFIGRTNELQHLHDWLKPKSNPIRQQIVSIVGMGGIGKTQLSLAHVRDCADYYSSAFWVNAKDEPSLIQSILHISAVIFHELPSTAQSTDDEKLKVEKVRRWLSEPGNDQWLLIFDNYDNPSLPGIDSSTGYDIRGYFPYRAQGSILITTRSPQLLFTKQLRLRKLEDITQSLAILATASSRNVNSDPSATRLAQRLDGLPLALATAGAYLSQSVDSFDDYFQVYHNSWNDLSQYCTAPMDYEERTLWSTWNVSFQQVQNQDPAAGELLKFLAYLDNQDFWYELFQAGTGDGQAWWVDVLASRARFNRAIATLRNYSLLEVSEGRCSLHTCVHDWTLEFLNQEVDHGKYETAIHCVAASVSWETEFEYWARNRRILPHARRFQHVRLTAAINWNLIKPDDLSCLAGLYEQNDMYVEAEEMYQWALQGKEKAWGVDHTSTLNTVNNLGLLYKSQGKMAEAEEMYQRALRGKEKAWGIDHMSTLDTVNNLGVLYKSQGKMAEAEEMYQRALQGYEKACGIDHTSTLKTVNNLGNLYAAQGKMAEAEEMYQRALRGYEKAWGVDHTSTLDTVNNLGILYMDQGKMAEAEEMYQRALRGKEKACGIDHTSTLKTVNNLGNLYTDQGKIAEAEEMYQRALRGYEIAVGKHHPTTKIIACNLQRLHARQQWCG